MDANPRVTSPSGVAVSLAALVLLITAGCSNATGP